MDLRQLATFQAVAKTLSFTRAAERLAYSQSNVTAQIQALEREFGAQLFDRLGRRITLTDAGTRLIPYVERLLMIAEEARNAMNGTGSVSGSVMIGSCETVCTYRLPAMLQAFHKRNPLVKLAIDSAHCIDLPGKLSRGEVDLAFILDHRPIAPEYEVESLATEPMAFVVPSDHRLSGERRIPLAAVDGERVLVGQSGCGYREIIETALARTGTHADMTLEFNSDEAIKQCVRSGIGVALLPLMSLQAELAAGTLVAIEVEELNVDVALRMAWHRDKWRSPAFEAFTATARTLLGTTALHAGALQMQA
jgi:DNA-binding transcriptional LysR family regulator